MSSDASSEDTAGLSTRDQRGALTGAAISAGFGVLWSVGAAFALSGRWPTAALLVGVTGGIAGVVVGILVLRRRNQVPARGGDGGDGGDAGDGRDRGRGGRGGDGGMFATRSFRVIVLVEVVAIVAGRFALARLGWADYVAIWVAFVVGVHFLAFGRQFWRGFFGIGAIMIAGVLLGVLLGVLGFSAGLAVAATAVVAALDLIVAAVVALT